MRKYTEELYQVSDHVRVNLSDLAEKVIFQSDLKIFEASADSHWTENQFINMLIKNYDGDFEIDLDLLSNSDGNYHSPRLNSDTLGLFNGANGSYKRNVKFKGDAGDKKFRCPQFIKCLLETYARLPFIEREKIVLKKSVIKPINDAISEGEKLYLTYAHGNKAYYIVSPICIAPAKEGTFQYLVAIDNDGKMESFRLSRIKEVTAEREKALRLPEHRLKEISEDLAEFGPTFIKEKKVKVKVRLTKSGIISYEYAVMHRPMHYDVDYLHDGKEGEDVFIFHCSEMQAQYFFFRFAGDVEILEPQSLRDKFRELYKAGLNRYL